MQVHTLYGDITNPASYEHHLKDADGVFVHVECECMSSPNFSPTTPVGVVLHQIPSEDSADLAISFSRQHGG